MFNIVIFGAPGSGKGTQSELMVKKYHFQHLSTGDLLREEIAAGSKLGKIAKEHIDSGELVPDHLIIEMIEKKIDEHIDGRGFIFDGFPRTVAQAKALDEMLEKRDTMVHMMLDMNVEFEELINRLLERGKTSGRADDNLETIQKRLKVYEDVTKPVMDYYKQTDRYFFIDNNGSVEDCHHQVVNAIESYDKN